MAEYIKGRKYKISNPYGRIMKRRKTKDRTYMAENLKYRIHMAE